MPSAFGFVQGVDSGSKFSATFVIDELEYSLNGMLNPPVGEFRSMTARLEFQDTGDLNGTQPLSGTIDDEELNLSLDNNIAVKAPLDMPVGLSTQVSGHGMWSVS